MKILRGFFLMWVRLPPPAPSFQGRPGPHRQGHSGSFRLIDSRAGEGRGPADPNAPVYRSMRAFRSHIGYGVGEITPTGSHGVVPPFEYFSGILSGNLVRGMTSQIPSPSKSRN